MQAYIICNIYKIVPYLYNRHPIGWIRGDFSNHRDPPRKISSRGVFLSVTAHFQLSPAIVHPEKISSPATVWQSKKPPELICTLGDSL